MSNVVRRQTGRIPVTLLTGYLGSGKTTLLNRAMDSPLFAKAAVVINEFGAEPLDPLYVEKTDGEVMVLDNACLCCDVQADPAGVIGRLFAQRGGGGRLLDSERMVIETSGIADPAPIMKLLLDQPVVTNNFRLENVVTVVDAVNGLRQIAEHEEAWNQVVLATRLVVAKGDLCSDAQLAVLERELEKLNPKAARSHALNGVMPPEALLGDGQDEEPQATRARFGGVRELEERRDAGLAPGRLRHIDGVQACALRCELPLDPRELERWLVSLRNEHGERLLRLKGIAEVHGQPLPVGLHAIHHVFHPARALPHLEGWRGTRLVLILRDSDAAAIGASWDRFVRSATRLPH